MKFAVVDIETTGLYHQGHGITEVSVVHVDGQNVRPVLHRLINPERSIPRAITGLTGIEEGMTRNASSFVEVLPEIAEALADRIFVAHNVNFDYQFLKSAFEAGGTRFQFRRFCTLRYSRKLLPDLRSHRLSALCNYFDIANEARHRAHGDALAAAHLLRALMQMDTDHEVMTRLLAGRDHHMVLPANLDEREVLDLPDGPGVYFFFGRTAKPLYIGKARSLKKRVLSHFTGAGSSRRKQLFQREVHRIEYRTAASEYQALLMEDAAIRAHLPKYNRAQKETAPGIALVHYTDRTDCGRLGLIRGARNADALAWFTSMQAAKQWVYKASLQYAFDPRRAGLPLTDDFGSEAFLTDDEAFAKFIDDCRRSVSSTYALLDQDGKYYALVNGGRYCGYGRLEESCEHSAFNFEKALTPAPDSATARAVVRRMLSDERIECISLT